MGIDVVLVQPGTYKTEIFTRDFARRDADPREVGRAIADAAALPNPPLRYVVGTDALMATVARWLLPQRWFERVLRRNFDRDEPLSD